MHADTPKRPAPDSTPSDGGSPEILSFELGPFGTNCAVVLGPAPGRCFVVDCGFDPGELIDAIRSRGLTPEACVLTHAHLDHIAGLFELRRAFPGVPVWIHRAEAAWLTDPVLNLSAGYGLPVTGPTPDVLLAHDDLVPLAGATWRVLHTPGHSPGGITLVHEPSRTAFVGDALFAGSIGRHDFPGSDFPTLERSIRQRLYTLPPETRVLPGHGPQTTIGREVASNPFVRG
jgi:glyoxylase-like metal-dependent hydrolase (beta-lactamase superfamily II)